MTDEAPTGRSNGNRQRDLPAREDAASCEDRILAGNPFETKAIVGSPPPTNAVVIVCDTPKRQEQELPKQVARDYNQSHPEVALTSCAPSQLRSFVEEIRARFAPGETPSILAMAFSPEASKRVHEELAGSARKELPDAVALGGGWLAGTGRTWASDTGRTPMTVRVIKVGHVPSDGDERIPRLQARIGNGVIAAQHAHAQREHTRKTLEDLSSAEHPFHDRDHPLSALTDVLRSASASPHIDLELVDGGVLVKRGVVASAMYRSLELADSSDVVDRATNIPDRWSRYNAVVVHGGAPLGVEAIIDCVFPPDGTASKEIQAQFLQKVTLRVRRADDNELSALLTAATQIGELLHENSELEKPPRVVITASNPQIWAKLQSAFQAFLSTIPPGTPLYLEPEDRAAKVSRRVSGPPVARPKSETPQLRVQQGVSKDEAGDSTGKGGARAASRFPQLPPVRETPSQLAARLMAKVGSDQLPAQQGTANDGDDGRQYERLVLEYSGRHSSVLLSNARQGNPRTKVLYGNGNVEAELTRAREGLPADIPTVLVLPPAELAATEQALEQLAEVALTNPELLPDVLILQQEDVRRTDLVELVAGLRSHLAVFTDPMNTGVPGRKTLSRAFVEIPDVRAERELLARYDRGSPSAEVYGVAQQLPAMGRGAVGENSILIARGLGRKKRSLRFAPLTEEAARTVAEDPTPDDNETAFVVLGECGPDVAADLLFGGDRLPRELEMVLESPECAAQVTELIESFPDRCGDHPPPNTTVKFGYQPKQHDPLVRQLHEVERSGGSWLRIVVRPPLPINRLPFVTSPARESRYAFIEFGYSLDPWVGGTDQLASSEFPIATSANFVGSVSKLREGYLRELGKLNRLGIFAVVLVVRPGEEEKLIAMVHSLPQRRRPIGIVLPKTEAAKARAGSDLSSDMAVFPAEYSGSRAQLSKISYSVFRQIISARRRSRWDKRRLEDDKRFENVIARAKSTEVVLPGPYSHAPALSVWDWGSVVTEACNDQSPYGFILLDRPYQTQAGLRVFDLSGRAAEDSKGLQKRPRYALDRAYHRVVGRITTKLLKEAALGGNRPRAVRFVLENEHPSAPAAIEAINQILRETTELKVQIHIRGEPKGELEAACGKWFRHVKSGGQLKVTGEALPPSLADRGAHVRTCGGGSGETDTTSVGGAAPQALVVDIASRWSTKRAVQLSGAPSGVELKTFTGEPSSIEDEYIAIRNSFLAKARSRGAWPSVAITVAPNSSGSVAGMLQCLPPDLLPDMVVAPAREAGVLRSLDLPSWLPVFGSSTGTLPGNAQYRLVAASEFRAEVERSRKVLLEEMDGNPGLRDAVAPLLQQSARERYAETAHDLPKLLSQLGAITERPDSDHPIQGAIVCGGVPGLVNGVRAIDLSAPAPEASAEEEWRELGPRKACRARVAGVVSPRLLIDYLTTGPESPQCAYVTLGVDHPSFANLAQAITELVAAKEQRGEKVPDLRIAFSPQKSEQSTAFRAQCERWSLAGLVTLDQPGRKPLEFVQRR